MGNATCDPEFRVCLNDTSIPGGNATCGNCQDGYIDIEIIDMGCLLIDDIDFNIIARLIEVFAPQYIDSSVTTETRVERLKFLARAVSFLESRIPPLPFDLELNEYSMDTEEERKQLLGTTVLENIDIDLPRFNFSDTTLLRSRLLQQELPSSVDWEEEGASKLIIKCLVMTMSVTQRS